MPIALRFDFVDIVVIQNENGVIEYLLCSLNTTEHPFRLHHGCIQKQDSFENERYYWHRTTSIDSQSEKGSLPQSSATKTEGNVFALPSAITANCRFNPTYS